MFLTNIACFCALAVAIVADEAANVLHYDTSAFETSVAKGPHFVMFYAPWCGHCKRLIPTWDELGKLHNQDRARQDITIAKVDCTVETALCFDHGVTGYPTLKLFSGSANPVKYTGTRSMAALVRFIETQLTHQQAGSNSEGSVRSAAVNGMVEWTEELFAKHVGEGRHFIEFFAPWCGHCKKLAPTWEQLAAQHANDLSLTIGRVDCTVEQALCQQQGVRGYPTLLWFVNGKKVGQYDGEREMSALTGYIRQMQLPAEAAAAAEVVPEPDVNTNAARDSHHWPTIVDGVVQLTIATFDDHTYGAAMFVKFMAPWCGHCKQLAPTWSDLAKALADDGLVIIAKVDCQQEGDLCRSHDIQGYPTLGWFVDGKLVDKYEGPRDIDALKVYVDRQKSELPVDRVQSLTASSFAKVITKGDHFVQFYTAFCRECRETQQMWGEVAKHFASDPQLTVSKVDCSLHQAVCSYRGVVNYPTMVYYRDGQQVEVYEHQLVVSHFIQFAQRKIKMRGLAKLAEAEQKSGGQQRNAKPTQQQDTADTEEVLSLTMDTFAHMTATGSTFVKFYAPWCGHCKKLAPTWVELAKRFAGSSSVRIVKVDCTIEQKLCQDHQVKGYPSLKLYREGVLLKRYDGGRDLDSLVQFVTSNVPVGRDEL